MDENNKFNEEMNSRPDEDWNKMLQADAQLQEQPAEQEPAKKAKSVGKRVLLTSFLKR